MRALRTSTPTSGPRWLAPPIRELVAEMPVHGRLARLGRVSVLAALRAYKLLLAPFFTGACRHLPSCSDYAAEAVVRHGVVRGSWLALTRLARCRPFGTSGYDPVPTAWPSHGARRAR